MSLFITGTGTGVGKTILTAGLAALLHRQGRSLCVYKPIQTGTPSTEPPEDLQTVKTLIGAEIPTFCSYCFPEPVAPYAADPDRTIQPLRILQDFKKLQAEYSVILVEGAGGVRVPVAQHFEMLDLIRMLQLPVVVATHPNLGTMNHTLLTVDALLAQRIHVSGVVISGMPRVSDDPAIQSLVETLNAFLPVPLLGTLPRFELKSGLFSPGNDDALKYFEALSLFESAPLSAVAVS